MNKKHTLWYCLSGLALIAILAITIVLNNNYRQSDLAIAEGDISIDNGDLKINWDRYPSYDITLDESLNISKSGVYHLTGSLENGNIAINVRDGFVKIILDNVSIKSSNGPAINCLEADDLVIEVVGKNRLEDAATFNDLDSDITGAIYSKADLTFEGSGVLDLIANYQDGIVGKDDLKFNSGTYNIAANDDGIRGKDSVYIVNGYFNITAKGDAIKSTNETTAGKGFVLIEDGIFKIDAETKGIKAINSVMIYGGLIEINSKDDSIHSNSYIGILDGDITISAGDDGIHADKKLIIEDGVIDIKKSYEGLEAQAITINNGKISIIANDDGMNAGGGADSSANNRPGANPFDINTDCVIVINGGDIYVNSAGDGIDSNGYLYFNSGNVVVDGPTNNGNGALDAGAEIKMTGGTVVAVGASGMAESLGDSSSIYNANIYFDATLKAGSVIKIKDTSGDTVISHTSKKSFNHMAVGAEQFEFGETYTIYVDGEKYQSFTISNIVTTVGNNYQNNMTPPGMMNGGGKR